MKADYGAPLASVIPDEHLQSSPASSRAPGPTEDADTPAAAVELLRAQLREHLRDGPVSWQISDDVLEGFHAGRMQVCPGDRNYDAEADEHVQEVRVNLIVELHDTAEAAPHSSRPGQGGAIAALPAAALLRVSGGGDLLPGYEAPPVPQHR